jgi:AcrR family transcriptional regulator
MMDAEYAVGKHSCKRVIRTDMADIGTADSATANHGELPHDIAAKTANQKPQKPTRRTSALRQRDADQTKVTILAAALAEFADKGLAGARVDEIARQTATSKHMIYYYFGSKDGLYRAVLDEVYKNFGAMEHEIDFAALDPVSALSTLVGVSFDYHAARPDYVRIIMGENMHSGEHIKHISGFEKRREIIATMAAILERGVASGVFRASVDPLQLHMTIAALCFYYIANRFSFGHIFGVDPIAPDMLATRRAAVVDTVLGGCRARAT